MAKKLKISKGDTVEVIAGSEKGKSGAVLELANKNNNPLKIKVKGVKIMTHFDKKESKQQKLEAFIDYSNVKLVSKASPSKKATKKA